MEIKNIKKTEEREKAVKLQHGTDGIPCWYPKSQIEFDEAAGIVEIPEWLLKKNCYDLLTDGWERKKKRIKLEIDIEPRFTDTEKEQIWEAIKNGEPESDGENISIIINRISYKLDITPKKFGRREYGAVAQKQAADRETEAEKRGIFLSPHLCNYGDYA